MMPGRWRRRLAQRLAKAGLAGAIIAVTGSGLALAAPGYGPIPPPPPVPGGYFRVVTSVTIGPAGGTVGPVRIDGVRYRLRVPRGTFPIQVQITLTAPEVGQIGNAGFLNERAFSGIGVLIQVNGQTFSGRFGRSLSLRMSSLGINARILVVVWNGRRFVTAHRVTGGGHTKTVLFSSEREQDFALLRHVGGGGRGRVTAVASHHRYATVLSREFLAPADAPLSGLGVLAPGWLKEFSRT
jgi:hypothetical protein